MDFAGNFNDPTKCNEYYSGEVWEDTAKSVITVFPGPAYGPCGNPVRTEATVKLVVAPDGSVTGTYVVTG